MKLLFNKEGSNPEGEIKEIIGSISADFKYKNLKSDIKSATIDVIKEIGEDTYDYFYDIYISEDDEEEEVKDLLDLVRYAVALKAILSYLPKNDIAISNNGRTMYRDENSVTAFEYQIINQDEALFRDYYKTLDNLFLMLEKKNPTIKGNNKWKDLDIYKKTQNSFIQNLDDFNKHYLLDSRFLFQKLAPYIEQCLDLEIKPIFKEEKFKEVLENQEGNYNSVYYYCQSACVNYAMHLGVKRFRVSMFPEGILQNTRSDRNTIKAKAPSQKMETELVAQEFHNDFLKSLTKIQSLNKEIAHSSGSVLNEKITGNNKYISL